MKAGLVSICSPCYNVAPYIPRFLDSLIQQTYKQLQIILVNDGATDETGEVIDRYIPLLEAEGYKVTYIVQENSGQSAAVNRALKEAQGEYLAWPDPDDWLTPDSVEKRVRFLQEHPEVALVRGNVENIRASDGQSLGTTESTEGEPFEIPDFAEKLIMVKTWYAPITCMVRMSAFDEVCPGREIYTSKWGGQNLQMMLPVVHRFPHRQLREVLGYYLIRDDSHSHNVKTADEHIRYILERQNIFLNTLRQIPELYAKYAQELIRGDAAQCFHHSLSNGNRVQARLYMNEMQLPRARRMLCYGHTCLPTPLYRIIKSVKCRLQNAFHVCTPPSFDFTVPENPPELHLPRHTAFDICSPILEHLQQKLSEQDEVRSQNKKAELHH